MGREAALRVLVKNRGTLMYGLLFHLPFKSGGREKYVKWAGSEKSKVVARLDRLLSEFTPGTLSRCLTEKWDQKIQK